MIFSIALLMAVQEAPSPVFDDRETRDPVTGEFPVEPYEESNENAGTRQFSGTSMAQAFGGQKGIQRIADRLVDISIEDPRIRDIFKGQDMVRLRRTLFEQFCFILNAGCDYSGRDMRAAHKNMGIQMADMNALVENLQIAMEEENVPFRKQNRFLAKLAPMKKDVVER
ncbi:group I truncated hemoglobin [Parasphingorhabdus cellanae]|uniref:Group 1 truncated hemoglobin n=1 Tax=Parasphingorhabdus cellanae TaxID=2806553 RepID=A0ABX7T6F7_9SPHN|nr:group 1 truncated hemoglobin [Parasphingorhabdus cellanae]QTD57173.1 group 1 truncated hemoglobin [Parasphingorhabdus cellanae]